MPTGQNRTTGLEVVQFPCLEDNYGYLIHDQETGFTGCIDTPDVGAIEQDDAITRGPHDRHRVLWCAPQLRERAWIEDSDAPARRGADGYLLDERTSVRPRQRAAVLARDAQGEATRARRAHHEPVAR